MLRVLLGAVLGLSVIAVVLAGIVVLPPAGGAPEVRAAPGVVAAGTARPPPESGPFPVEAVSALRDHATALGIFTWHQPEWLLEAAFTRVRTDEALSAREAAEEIRGMPDLILFYRGNFMAIETKTELGKLTTSQRKWKDWLNGLVIVDVEEGIQAISEWKAVCDS